jgi:hypothetical protein
LSKGPRIVYANPRKKARRENEFEEKGQALANFSRKRNLGKSKNQNHQNIFEKQTTWMQKKIKKNTLCRRAKLHLC